MKKIQRADVDADGDSPARRVRVGPQLGQPDQNAQKPVRRGVEVARALAKVCIVEARERRSDLFERARDRPLRREALVVDEPARLTRELGAADDQTVEIDDLEPGSAGNSAELQPQPLELLVGRAARQLETRQLGLPIVA